MLIKVPVDYYDEDAPVRVDVVAGPIFHNKLMELWGMLQHKEVFQSVGDKFAIKFVSVDPTKWGDPTFSATWIPNPKAVVAVYLSEAKTYMRVDADIVSFVCVGYYIDEPVSIKSCGVPVARINEAFCRNEEVLSFVADDTDGEEDPE